MGTLTASAPPRGEPSPAREMEVSLRRGARLGRYELVRRIATGGMAHVWVARQRGDFGFARTVAVKVIRPEYAEDPTFRRMFLDEARLAAGIVHPNVIQVHDLGEEGSIVYLAMELLEGASLAQLLGQASRATGESSVPLPPAIAARIVADMAAGLHAAHELKDEQETPLNLVHRDVSPQNILVSLGGVAKIADFGIAKASGRLTEETDAGQMKGKWSYLSPEQLRREPLDRRSDVFSAGIVLWEALTGRRLFRGEDVLDTITRVTSLAVPDPRSIAPAVSAALSAVTFKALQREPGRRFQTAAELSDAVEEAARAAGDVATNKQLAEFVAARAGREVSERRAAIAVDLTELDAPAGADTIEEAQTPASRGRKPLGVAMFAALVVGTGAAGMALGMRAGGRAATPADVVGAATEPSAAPSAPPAASEAAPAASSAASAATDGAPSDPKSASAPARARPPTPRATARPRSSSPAPSTQKIPFTNPYER